MLRRPEHRFRCITRGTIMLDTHCAAFFSRLLPHRPVSCQLDDVLTGNPADAVPVPMGIIVIDLLAVIGVLTDAVAVGYGFDFVGVGELQFSASVTIGFTPGIIGHCGRSVPFISSGLKPMGPPIL